MQKGKSQTGACGICCDVCGLKAKGICNGCHPGDTPEAKEKVEFLEKIGKSCPILACAVDKNVSFCLKDCKSFPCEKFKETHYPYGREWLQMYSQRLKE